MVWCQMCHIVPLPGLTSLGSWWFLFSPRLASCLCSGSTWPKVGWLTETGLKEGPIVPLRSVIGVHAQGVASDRSVRSDALGY